MAQTQIPFLSVPFKRTTDVDWTFPLKSYIAQVYQEDPEKYSEEAYTLNRLRQDTRGAGKDLTGRDLLYRYFGQLELLDLRFPVDERNVKVLFNWYVKKYICIYICWGGKGRRTIIMRKKKLFTFGLRK